MLMGLGLGFVVYIYSLYRHTDIEAHTHYIYTYVYRQLDWVYKGLGRKHKTAFQTPSPISPNVLASTTGAQSKEHDCIP